MNIEILRNFFLWCTLINYGILLLWCVVFKFAHDWHFEITNKWWPVTVETYDGVNFAGVAAFKLGILMFNLVPYIALRLVG